MKIHLNHLSMTYPTGKQALKDINLTLESPSLIGLVGPNGAGKSTDEAACCRASSYRR